MKFKLSFVSIIQVLLLTFFLNFAFAQNSPINDLSGDPVEELIETWGERSETISLGKDNLGLENLEIIKKKMTLYGIRNAPQIAVALIDEIKERDSELSKKEKTALLKFAKEIAPDIASLNIKLAGYFLSPSYFSLKNSISSMKTGFSKYLSGIESRFRFITNILYWSWLALCFTVFIFFLVMTLKYFHALIHMTEHFLPKAFSKTANILLLMFIPIVFFLTLGPLSLVLVFAAYYWLLANGSEKFVMCVFIAILICIPHIFYFTAFPYRYQKSNEKKILSVELSPDLKKSIEAMEEITKNFPDDTEAEITLALLHKKLGNYLQAKNILKNVLSKNPGNTKALINIGNIHYIQGKLAAAISSYSKAGSINSQSFLANYNLGKALYSETRIEEADQALKKASSINSSRFKKFESLSNPKNPLEFVFDEKIDKKDLKQRIAALKSPSSEFRNKIWAKKRILNTTPWGASITGLIVFIILILLSKFTKLIEPPRVCEICGKAFCKKCSRLSEHRDICSPCHFIFIRKESLEPVFKTKKENEEKRHRIFQGIFKSWISFLLPGLGHLYFGKSIAGIFVVFLLALVFSWIYIPQGLIEDPFTGSLKGTNVSLVMVLLAALAVYIITNLTIRKVK